MLKCMHFKMQHNKNMSSDLYNSHTGQDYKDFELPRPHHMIHMKHLKLHSLNFARIIFSVLKY